MKVIFRLWWWWWMTNEWTSHLVQIFEKKKGEFEFHFYMKNNLIWWDLYIALAVVLLSIWMLFILFSVHSTTTFSLVFFLFFLLLLRVRYSPLTFNIFLPHPIAFFLLSSRTFSMLYKASGAHTRYLSIICSLTSPTFFFVSHILLLPIICSIIVSSFPPCGF